MKPLEEAGVETHQVMEEIAAILPARLVRKTNLGIVIMRHHVKALQQVGAEIIAQPAVALHAVHQ